jgi:hypothetical protein
LKIFLFCAYGTVCRVFNLYKMCYYDSQKYNYSKNLSILTQKSFSKLSEICSGFSSRIQILICFPSQIQG